jgi:uncharacterized protein DUF5683
MTRLAVVLLLASLLIPSRSSAQHRLADLTWEPVAALEHGSVSPLLAVQAAQADSARRHKSPVLAWFLSWLVPGGGQAYNGQWTKAAAFFGAAAAGFALVVSNDGFNCTNDCGTRDAGLVVLAISSIGSQIEAPIAASSINREAKKRPATQVSLSLMRVHF